MVNRNALLNKLSALDFMLLDLGLYLNTHPDDQKALEIYTTVCKDSDELRQRYESQFGPLTHRGLRNAKSFTWVDEPWPWEADFNFDNMTEV